MDKYVKINPAMEEKMAINDFKLGGDNWTHVIKDKNGNSVFFGDLDPDNGEDFNFCDFRLRVTSNSGYCWFSWPAAQEFAETILELAKQHGGCK